MRGAQGLLVQLGGVSRVVGGADGWADEGAAAFSFEVCSAVDGCLLHAFSTRYSRALAQHEQMMATGLEPLRTLAFPAKRRLSNMRDDVDNVLSRGQELASYYATLLAAAADDPATRAVVSELLGIPPGWAAGVLQERIGESNGSALDGVVELECGGNPPLLLRIRCENGIIREICTPESLPPAQAAVARISASQLVWGDCFKALLQTVPSSQTMAECAVHAAPTAATADARETAAVAARKAVAAAALSVPQIIEPRLRHGLLHTGLAVRVEYQAVHCNSVRLRWYRRAPLETPRSSARRRRQPKAEDQLSPLVYIEGAVSAELILSPVDVGCTVGCECIGIGEPQVRESGGGDGGVESAPTLVEQLRGSGTVGYAPTVLKLTSTCACERATCLPV